MARLRVLDRAAVSSHVPLDWLASSAHTRVERRGGLLSSIVARS